MNRSLTVAVAFVVACSVLVPATFATGVVASEHEIDSCTVLDEPGEYEFVEDVQTDQTGSCIEIQADNVTIDGNGHVLAGPGADSNSTGFEIDNRVSDVTIRNVEVAGWERGLDARGSYTLEDAVVRDNDDGLFNDNAIPADLRNVTVEGNNNGISSSRAGVNGVNVTVRENGNGIFGMDGGNYDLEDSRVVDNEGYGVKIEHSSLVTLNDSTVSGNGGHGIYFPWWGKSATGHVENTTVSDNGGDGIRTASDAQDPLRLVEVTVEGNDGLEVNAAPVDEPGDPADTTSSLSATDLQVGPSATTAFEEEAIRLEPVDRESLPDREDGTAVGDGLNVSGNVSGPVDLELDVDTDDDTVDLWRHDGGEWETVEEDLDASDGSVEATVEDFGVYAPGTEADDSQDDTGDDDPDESDDTGDDSEDSDDSDDSQDDSDDQDDTGDDDGEKDSGPSDDDGEKDDEKSSGSNCGCPASDDDDAGEDDDSSTDGSDTDDGTTEDDDTGEDDESASGDGTTGSPEDHEQRADDDTGTTDGDDDSQGDGPGFGAVTALVALLAGVLVIRRRE